MKLSDYLIEVQKGDDINYIFSTLRGCKVAARQKMDEIKFYLDTKQLDRIMDYDELRKNGIILENHEDEAAVIAKMRKCDFNGEDILAITILPTGACNAKCVYCYEEFDPFIIKESVMQGIINYVAKEIKNFSMLNISWFGGEPLIAVSAIEKLSRAFSALCIMHKRKMAASITTNATLLDYKMFSKLVNYQIRNYQITLDGLEAVHNRLRPLKNGQNSFQMILKNLREIRENYTKKDVVIRIRCNMTKSASGDAERFIHFLSEEFGKDDRFLIDFKRAADWGGETVSQIKDELLKEEGTEYYIRCAREAGLSMQHYRGLFQPCANVCYAAHKNHIVIDPMGKIYKCTIAFREEYNQIGYIEENGNLVIDTKKLDQWIHPAKLEKCQNCKMLPICMGSACPNSLIKSKWLRCPNELVHIEEFIEIL